MRDLVNSGQRHKSLDDVWAVLQFIEVRAASKEQAIRRINNRDPAGRGFVITRVFGPEDAGG